MRDLSFYNELLQNEDRRHRNQLNVIDSQLEAIKPWVQLSKKASKIAYDLGEKRNEKAQADHQIKILTADEWDPSVINKHNKQKRDFKLADNNLNNEIIGLKKEGYGPTLINYLKSLRGGAKIGAAEGFAERIADNYPAYLEAQLAENDSLFIDQTAEGGRRFAVNDVQTESELREALGVLKKEYWEKSGLTGINTLIVRDKAWKKIKTAESNLIKAKQKQDSILQGIKETDEAIVRFKSDGDYVALLTSIAATDDDNGKARSWTDAKKIALTTIKKMAADPTITEERLDDIIEGIAKQSPSHMKGTYGEFNPGFIEELKTINREAWKKIEDDKEDERNQLYDSLENEWEDFAKENEITEANKKAMSKQVLAMTGRKATFLQDYETRQERNDDQARIYLNRTEFLRGYLTKEDLLPFSDTIRTEFSDQVQKGKDLRKFNDDYSEKIDNFIDRQISDSRGLNWFNKGGDLEFEMKDIMEADIDSMTRDLLTDNTPENAYKLIKDHVRAKIKNKDGENEYLNEAKLAIKSTFDKGTTREFRKDLARAMAPLASNPSLYNKLVVVDKEYLDAAEKYRDTAQDGDPVPEIFSMLAKEFPTLEPFDIMNGQLEAAGLKPVEKPKIEQDIDNAPDNLLRTLRCQPTQTGLARCYVEVQRLKGEDKDGYQMDWSNPEFLTPGIEY